MAAGNIADLTISVNEKKKRQMMEIPSYKCEGSFGGGL